MLQALRKALVKRETLRASLILCCRAQPSIVCMDSRKKGRKLQRYIPPPACSRLFSSPPCYPPIPAVPSSTSTSLHCPPHLPLSSSTLLARPLCFSLTVRLSYPHAPFLTLHLLPLVPPHPIAQVAVHALAPGSSSLEENSSPSSCEAEKVMADIVLVRLTCSFPFVQNQSHASAAMIDSEKCFYAVER
eukprot:757887-Hanusia_phi.AAC.1